MDWRNLYVNPVSASDKFGDLDTSFNTLCVLYFVLNHLKAGKVIQQTFIEYLLNSSTYYMPYI